MYHFKEDISRIAHFWFDKRLFDNMHWAMLKKSSKAIFPVIAAHRNQKGLAFSNGRKMFIDTMDLEAFIERNKDRLI